MKERLESLKDDVGDRASFEDEVNELANRGLKGASAKLRECVNQWGAMSDAAKLRRIDEAIELCDGVAGSSSLGSVDPSEAEDEVD